MPQLTTSLNFFVKKRFKNEAGAADAQPSWTQQQYDDALKKAQQIHTYFQRLHQQDRDRIRTAKSTHLGLVLVDDAGNRITDNRPGGQRVRGTGFHVNTAAGEDEEGERTYQRQYGRHADEELKRVLEVYLFCHGDVTPAQINDILGELYTNGSYGEGRAWVKRYRSHAQHSTLAWFEIVLKDMLKSLGNTDLAKGLEIWYSFPISERNRYLTSKLDEAPEVILRHAFQLEANSIDFVKIWNHHIPSKTKQWRNCTRTKFVNMANKVIEHSIKVHNATERQKKTSKKYLFDFWKTHMRMPVFDEFELGCRIDQVPTLASRQETFGNLSYERAEEEHEMQAIHGD